MIETLKSNLDAVLRRIAEATKRSGRPAGSVKLIGVSKYVDVETTRMLVAAGCDHLGESRPQVLWEKSEALADLPVDWHMIGHLQRNKVKRTVACSDLIHSVDSQRLLTAIDDAGRESNKVVDVLLEVNVSREANKHGFADEDLPSTLAFVSKLEHVAVQGLMCMAGLDGSLDDARREFATIRALKERLQPNAPDNVELTELSMGMSGDFETAVEEGATMVRIGSILFDGI
jgi:pyridoxal phosphate enzyme (YggS family)